MSTPLEWGQAWLERALLVKAPVLLSEGKLELGEHSLELLYCCHCRQAASNVLTHLYQPVTGRRPASPLLPFRNCYFRPRRLWPRLLPPFFVWSRTQNKGGISVLLNLVLPPHISICIYTHMCCFADLPINATFFALCCKYFFKWFCKISLPRTFGLRDDWYVDFSIWLGFNGEDNSNKSDRAQKWGSVIEYSSNMWQPQTHTYSYTNTIC